MTKPLTPTNLLTEGKTNPLINNKSPKLSWTFVDPNTGDTQSALQVQWVKRDGNFVFPEYDSRKIDSSDNFYSIPSITLGNGIYFWRVRVWDSNDEVSPWTSGDTYFTLKVATATQQSILIDGGALTTLNGKVDLELTAPGATQMKITEDSSDKGIEKAEWEPYKEQKEHKLEPKPGSEKEIHAKFKEDDTETPIASDDIKAITDKNINVRDWSTVNAQKHKHYPFTGYHRFTPYQYLNSCRLDVYVRHIQRLEMMLQATGERVTLYRRRWSGEMCYCVDTRRGQFDKRCPSCFGTGWVGGYEKYENPEDPFGKIWVRFAPVPDDLNLQSQGMRQDYIPNLWTLPVPVLKDRDVIVRYDASGKEVWRFVILNATRNVGFFGKFVSQMFSMQRLDKTDPAYKVP